MAKIVKALRGVHVRVVASPDLDVLDDETKIRKLVEAFDGTWQPYEGDYQVATRPFRAAVVDATAQDVLSAVTAELSKQPEEPWTEDVRERVKPLLRTSRTKWRDLKRYGEAAFSGESAVRAAKLLDALEALGVCCVRDGELERMAPTVGVAKGPRWLAAALEASAQGDAAAQAHIRRLMNSGSAASQAGRRAGGSL